MKKVLFILAVTVTLTLTGCNQETDPFSKDFENDKTYTLEEKVEVLDMYHSHILEDYTNYQDDYLTPREYQNEPIPDNEISTEYLNGGFAYTDGNYYFGKLQDLLLGEGNTIEFDYSPYYELIINEDKIKGWFVYVGDLETYEYIEFFANIIDGKLYYEMYTQRYKLDEETMIRERYMVYHEDTSSIYKGIEYTRGLVTYQESSSDSNDTFTVQLSSDGYKNYGYANFTDHFSYSKSLQDDVETYFSVANKDLRYTLKENGDYFYQVLLNNIEGWNNIRLVEDETRDWNSYRLYNDHILIEGSYRIFSEYRNLYLYTGSNGELTNENLSLSAFNLSTGYTANEILALKAEGQEMIDLLLLDKEVSIDYNTLRQEFIDDISRDAQIDLFQELQEGIRNAFNNN